MAAINDVEGGRGASNMNMSSVDSRMWRLDVIEVWGFEVSPVVESMPPANGDETSSAGCDAVTRCEKRTNDRGNAPRRAGSRGIAV
jgi:hypothetical protein